MRVLVTGSSGHLGEALVRLLRAQGADVRSIDINPSEFTSDVASITDCRLTDKLMEGVEVVFHTATLHKPHVATHSKQDFIETNISGTQNLLDAAVRHNVRAFIFTSTTSTFGHAMRPEPGGPTIWVDESLRPHSQKYLRRHQIGSGKSVRLGASRGRT